MSFTVLDWSAIVGYLVITLILGLWFRSRSGNSVDDYFVSGRNVTWWLAGTSMVATTFAADTPLVVTGGRDKVNVALIGGDNDRYLRISPSGLVRRDREWLATVLLDQVTA